MKLIIGLMAAAGLTGCVGYGGGYYGTSGAYYGDGASYYNGGYYSSPPAYIYGGTYSRGYRDGRGMRDRDRDGVPNRYDGAPANPYRR